MEEFFSIAPELDAFQLGEKMFDLEHNTIRSLKFGDIKKALALEALVTVMYVLVYRNFPAERWNLGWGCLCIGGWLMVSSLIWGDTSGFFGTWGFQWCGQPLNFNHHRCFLYSYMPMTDPDSPTRSSSFKATDACALIQQNFLENIFTCTAGFEVSGVSPFDGVDGRQFLRQLYNMKRNAHISMQAIFNERDNRPREERGVRFNILISRVHRKNALFILRDDLEALSELIQTFRLTLTQNFNYTKFELLRGLKLVSAVFGGLKDFSACRLEAILSEIPPLYKDVASFVWFLLSRMVALGVFGLLVRQIFQWSLDIFVFGLIGLSPIVGFIGFWYLLQREMDHQGFRGKLWKINPFKDTGIVAGRKICELYDFHASPQAIRVMEIASLEQRVYETTVSADMMLNAITNMAERTGFGVVWRLDLQRLEAHAALENRRWFRDEFVNKAWSYKEDKNKIFYRYSGVFGFRVLVAVYQTVAYQCQPRYSILHSIAEEVGENLRRTLNATMEVAYPNGILEFPNLSQTLWVWLTHTHLFTKFGTSISRFIETGKNPKNGGLSTHIGIPAALKRHLPVFYPADFPIPTLTDDFVLGTVVNSETNICSVEAGLTQTELRGNVILSGKYGYTRWATLKLAAEAILARIPTIIFDTDRSSVMLYGYLEPHRAQTRVGTHIAGQSIGVQLFSAPVDLTKAEYLTYLHNILRAMQTAFKWPQEAVDETMGLFMTKLSSQKLTLGSLKELIATANLSESRKNAAHPVFEKCIAFEQPGLRDTFNSPLTKYAPATSFTHPLTSHIINLSSLSQENRVLFILVFLYQYCAILDATPTERVAKTMRLIVLPKLEELFNRATNETMRIQIEEIIRILGEKGVAVIGETEHLAEVSQAALSEFHSFIAYQTQGREDIAESVDRLKLSSAFKFLKPHSQMREGYQQQYFQHLTFDQCIVYREPFRMPFLCQFPLRNTFSRELIIRLDKASLTEVFPLAFSIPHHALTAKKEIRIEQREFKDAHKIILRIFKFMQFLVEAEPVMSEKQIKNELFRMLFDQKDSLVVASMDVCRRVIQIFQDLVRFGYLEPAHFDGQPWEKDFLYRFSQKFFDRVQENHLTLQGSKNEDIQAQGGLEFENEKYQRPDDFEPENEENQAPDDFEPENVENPALDDFEPENEEGEIAFDEDFEEPLQKGENY